MGNYNITPSSLGKIKSINYICQSAAINNDIKYEGFKPRKMPNKNYKYPKLEGKYTYFYNITPSNLGKLKSINYICQSAAIVHIVFFYRAQIADIN